MNRIEKIAALIKEMDFALVSKVVISISLSIIWIVILAFGSNMYTVLFSERIQSVVESLVIWSTITLPLFGALYHKIFSLIDAKSSAECYKHQLMFGSAAYRNLPYEKECLRKIKHKNDRNLLSRVQVFLGADAQSLDLFNQVFGDDPHSLQIHSINDMRKADLGTKYFYLDLLSIDEKDLKVIKTAIDRINEGLMCRREERGTR